jgi:hydrogenase maturation protein HypF
MEKGMKGITTRNHLEPSRIRLQLSGIVQGVGFRPFVSRLATQLQLTGFVYNHPRGVTIEAQGPASQLEAFQTRLTSQAPPAARIDRVATEFVPCAVEASFSIRTSRADGAATAIVSPDLCVCSECLAELQDVANRRFGYPFINCTQCGPRFTIVRRLPYDRANTTMESFIMCDACQAEYDNPRDRRFHAQPNACPTCGPQVWFVDADHRHDASWFEGRAQAAAQGGDLGETAIQRTREAIQNGQVVAVKGIGGFHLICDATNVNAVATLRQRKQRSAKPLAVMVQDLAAAKRIVHVGPIEQAMLTSVARPIVLASLRVRRAEVAEQATDWCRAVAPRLGWLGILLPQSPLHELLTTNMPPLVFTSGNLSEEPLVFRNRDAHTRLQTLADAFLLHDRDIHTPCDDSVIRVIDDQPMFLRRARGYVPIPISLRHVHAESFDEDARIGSTHQLNVLEETGKSERTGTLNTTESGKMILGVGAELKATFCLIQGDQAHVSQHLGDMEDLTTLRVFEYALDNLLAQSGKRVELIAHDLHPSMLSTQWATRYAAQHDLPMLAIQHHHAHVAAVMAEQTAKDLPAEVLGVCFDGTGYGTDGAIWGGEWLLVSSSGSRRVAHLKYVPLPGGDAAVRNPYRMALAHLWAAKLDWDPRLPCVQACETHELSVLLQQLKRNVNCIPTSSVGRWFDAVASIIGIQQSVDYEAQAALELEAAAGELRAEDFDAVREPAWQAQYGAESVANQVTADQPLVFDPSPMVRAVVNEVLGGVPAERIARQFHAAVVQMTVEMCQQLQAKHGVATVALCGGVFQNAILTRAVSHGLRQTGFEVLLPRLLPPNDAAISLGQAQIASWQVDSR